MSVNKLLEKIDFYLGEEKESKIDGDSVGEALKKTGKDVFDDEYDEKKVKDIFNAVKKKNPEDTEDAIGIGQGMLRAD